MFEDILNDEVKDVKSGEIFHKTIPLFSKYNLYIYLSMAKFARIQNIFSNENLKFKVYINPDNYQEYPFLVKNNIANINKEIHFKVYLPCFLERILIEIYDEE